MTTQPVRDIGMVRHGVEEGRLRLKVLLPHLAAAISAEMPNGFSSCPLLG